MLTVSKLNLEYHTDHKIKPILSDVSFNLGESEQLAIVGESGSGKTMLAHALMGLLPNNILLKAETLQFEGNDLTLFKEQDWCRIRNQQIGMIFQEPLSAFNPLQTIKQQLKESILIKRPYANWQQELYEWLDRVRLAKKEDILSAYPHELSGGQRQRLMIVMALVNHPKVLIADEPTTALDVQIQVQILNVLKELQRELDMALILISHDLSMVSHLADRVLVMRQGVVDVLAAKDALFSTPPTPYTQQLLGSYTCQPTSMPKQLEVVLSVENCSVYPKRHHQPIVHSVSFELYKGVSLGLIGESGSGKTSLAMGLCRIMPMCGQVMLKRHDWLKLSSRQAREQCHMIQIVFQDPFSSLSPRLTVAEIIGEGVRSLNRKALDDAVINAMHQVQLDPNDRFKYPHEFSGGERQRVAIARALVMQPDILILDEPTSALDKSVRDQILNLLVSLQAKHQIAYLVITHDLDVIKAMCHQVMVFKGGQVEEMNTVNGLLHHPEKLYTKRLIQAQQLLVEEKILR